MPLTATLSLLTACFFWAISFIATKVALDSAPPLTVVALRLLVSALCFGVWLAVADRSLLRKARRWAPTLIGLSLVGTGLHYGVQTIGLQYTTASNGSLYAVTGPITIAVLGAFFLSERLTVTKVAGIAVALVGVLTVMGADTLSGVDLGSHVLGDLLVLASIVMWGIFTVFGKRITDELGAVAVTAIVTVIGAAYMIPVAAVEVAVLDFHLGQITLAGWAAIGFLGVSCSFLATLLYFVALERSESQKVGVFLYTIPPMTAVVAYFWLNETLSLGFFIGSALVLVGVALTDRG